MNLNLPSYEFRVLKNGDDISIYDRLRKKFVALTPEENVRQHFVEYLIRERLFPAGLMNNEIAIMQNGIKRRCDTVIFDRTGEPLMIVEYKAPHVKITQEVFNQIYRYNLVLKVKYLVVTNGMVNYCCKIDYEARSCQFLSNIPMYDTL